MSGRDEAVSLSRVIVGITSDVYFMLSYVVFK